MADIKLVKSGKWTFNGLGTDLIEGEAGDVIKGLTPQHAAWMRNSGAAEILFSETDQKEPDPEPIETEKEPAKVKLKPGVSPNTSNPIQRMMAGNTQNPGKAADPEPEPATTAPDEPVQGETPEPPAPTPEKPKPAPTAPKKAEPKPAK